MRPSLFYKFSFFATLLAFLVILLGSYVRLSNAGLGCPDWPGCYGKLMVPAASIVQSSHPNSEFSSPKAWKEMIHRYLAGGLGISIFVLFVLSLCRGDPVWSPGQPHRAAPTRYYFILVLIVIFQAMLGMWTVTLKLHPLVVMGHLIGGYTTFILLAWQTLRMRGVKEPALSLSKGKGRGRSTLKFFTLLGLLFLILQIILGGWLSANYASLACPDFPTCQGKWWPEFHFSQAFTFWHSFGPNYEWGILNNTARVTIHMMHRLGSLIVFTYWIVLSLILILRPFYADFRKNGLFILLCLLTQMSLGISNVIFHLPLQVTVAHTGMAALLLFSIIHLWIRLSLQNQEVHT